MGKNITVHLFAVSRKSLRNYFPITVVVYERGKLMRSVTLNKRLRIYKYKKNKQILKGFLGEARKRVKVMLSRLRSVLCSCSGAQFLGIT